MHLPMQRRCEGARRRAHIDIDSESLIHVGTIHGPVRQLLEGAVFGPHFGRLVTGFCDFSYNLNRFK